MRARSLMLLLAVAACSFGYTPAAAAQAGDSSGVRTMVVYRESFPAAYGAAALNAFTPELDTPETGGECQMWHLPKGIVATNMNAWFPNHVKPMLTVEMSFDSTGALRLYHETRGPLVMATLPRSITTLAQRDSAHLAMRVDRRFTNIAFDYSTGEAILRNYGAGKLDNAVVAKVSDVESLRKLGPVIDRIARVRKLCGL